MDKKSVFDRIKGSSILPICILLVGIMLLFGITTDNFFSKNNILLVLRQVSMIGIAGCGMIMVLLSGGIDLSIGAMVTFVNVACAAMMVNWGFHPVFAVLVSILLSTVLGTINGVLIAKFRLMPFITTLCMSYVLKGMAYITTKSQPIYGLPTGFKVLGQGYALGIPVPVIIMLVITLITGIFLRRTYLGRYFYYLGGNEEATKLSGVNTQLVRVLAYTFSGFFTGIAAVIWLSRINSGQPSTGSGFEFDVICALVLGGISASGGEGGILGGLIGAITIGFLNNGMTMLNLSEYHQMVVKGFVLLLAIILDRIKTNAKQKTKA